MNQNVYSKFGIIGLNLNKKFDKILLKNTETLGITTEHALCIYYNITHKISDTRVSKPLSNILVDCFNKCKLSNYINLNKHIGGKNTYIDFLNKEQTISVKTNYSTHKICPSTIGQTTKKKWLNHFDIDLVDNKNIKNFIVKNINNIFSEYLSHLFCCDKLVYLKCKKIKKTNNILIDTLFISPKLNINNSNLNFHFSHLIKNKEWNESTTLYIQNSNLNKNYSIGEFQIHNKRNCIKFRINLLNLLEYKFHMI